ncbi:uncharacterized protein LOC102347041 [Latimeria chalumnae]|uniref:uncharacterized protein LOC102347041 n=1 Tax=Latimeria chalumnae TaxID=7897 RepID=UPI0003C11E75|nr:PREDICTED: uncharacterized protein LOC102347041 [Latimeria chalumnae]|eukprot:XP_005987679.1 PREDICTED: uncharacterized protein LOC102347041 [Latimeria chalumnae]
MECFEKQTKLIVDYYLFCDEEQGNLFRNLQSPSSLETDSVAEDGPDYAIIGSRLRAIGDQFSGDVEAYGNQLLPRIKDVPCQQAVEEFSKVVFSIGNQWVPQTIASEKAIISAAVAIGSYIVSKVPTLLSVVQASTTTVLTNPLVRTWVEQQGGWENVVPVE